MTNHKLHRAWDKKNSSARDPDGLGLEVLKQFFIHNKIFDDETLCFIDLVQCRRNAIHAYIDRPLGDGFELLKSIRDYRTFLREVNSRLPYPNFPRYMS